MTSLRKSVTRLETLRGRLGPICLNHIIYLDGGHNFSVHYAGVSSYTVDEARARRWLATYQEKYGK